MPPSPPQPELLPHIAAAIAAATQTPFAADPAAAPPPPPTAHGTATVCLGNAAHTRPQQAALPRAFVKLAAAPPDLEGAWDGPALLQ